MPGQTLAEFLSFLKNKSEDFWKEDSTVWSSLLLILQRCLPGTERMGKVGRNLSLSDKETPEENLQILM